MWDTHTTKYLENRKCPDSTYAARYSLLRGQLFTRFFTKYIWPFQQPLTIIVIETFYSSSCILFYEQLLMLSSFISVQTILSQRGSLRGEYVDALNLTSQFDQVYNGLIQQAVSECFMVSIVAIDEDSIFYTGSNNKLSLIECYMLHLFIAILCGKRWWKENSKIEKVTFKKDPQNGISSLNILYNHQGTQLSLKIDLAISTMT